MLSEVLNCSYFFDSVLSPKSYSLVVTAVSVVVVYITSKSFILKKNRKLYILGVALFILGGLLNTIERFKSGCVLDYFDFMGLFMFNVNDLMVSIGVLLILVSQFVTFKKDAGIK